MWTYGAVDSKENQHRKEYDCPANWARQSRYCFRIHHKYKSWPYNTHRNRQIDSIRFCITSSCKTLYVNAVNISYRQNHHQGPRVQWLLVSSDCLTIWRHSDLSAAFILSLNVNQHLHHSSASSVHLLLGLPPLFDPSIILITICVSNLSFAILHTCPKRFSFFSVIFWTMFRVTLILVITSSFIIFMLPWYENTKIQRT